ncbi:hypothetical protein CEUSTIGMA_g2847.t1 [Chlamydomonas eustigma]|uniref:Kinesin motor domain-containing protein n=1 Tax=Chlamydomonas eustigma TaxID=1157962 RepID=A0A250WX34_9CHLO|nr:hypothetical protein CEUSTIGMA_g2847.t1 [Chlamydomonas eustigma]|eukprot:GAX75403.1 hypothetical protein CEUSTIGMA_g2847.t1 [Chlamydomonas eustigma]
MTDNWSRGLRGDNQQLSTPRGTKNGRPSPRSSDFGDYQALLTPSPEVGVGRANRSVKGVNNAPTAPVPPASALKPPLRPPKINVQPSVAKALVGSAPGSPDSTTSADRSSSMFLVDDAVDGDSDSVQVFVRVRPCNSTELEAAGGEDSATSCVQVIGESSIVASNPGKERRRFTYDKVLPESSSQLDLFEVVGVPMVDNCISGYNSAIFVYGQTGAGKTWTMMGDLQGAGTNKGMSEERGLAPRMIELLFEKINLAEDTVGGEPARYNCRCSCLEIYNETITDLLNPTATNLQLREDPVKGIYVDGLSEKEVLNVDDVLSLMRRGNSHRHVGETNMNARSSRSHCVFTCMVEKSSKTSGSGATGVVASRLNLIDLAGSERIKGGALGGSQAQGEHFKEAVHINQSLSTLGRVIMVLVEAQNGRGKQQQAVQQAHTMHIPYRDSRLTFLLQDSLGGNAKTMIIANVSASPLCAAETLSTLQFASRAKCIRNHATINLNYRGDVAMLQKEVLRLNAELDNLRKGFTDPAIQENKELRGKVDILDKQQMQNELLIHNLTAEASRHKKERTRMEARLENLQAGQVGIEVLMEKLRMQLEETERQEEAAHEAAFTTQSYLTQDVVHWRQQAELSAAQLRLSQDTATSKGKIWQTEKEELEAKNKEARATIKDVQNKLSVLGLQAQEAQVARDALEETLEGTRQQLLEAQEASATLAALYSKTKEELLRDQAALETSRQALSGLKDNLQEVQGQREEGVVLLRELALQKEVHTVELEGQLGSLRSELEELRHKAAEKEQELNRQMTEHSAECDALKEELSQERSSRAQAQEQLTGRAAEQERRLREALELKHAELQSLLSEVDELQHALASERDRVQEVVKEVEQEAAARSAAEVLVTDLQEEVQRMKEDMAGQQVKAEELITKLREDAEHYQESYRQETLQWREERKKLQEQVCELMEKAAKEAENSVAEMMQKRKSFEELQLELQEVKRNGDSRAALLMQEKAALISQVGNQEEQISTLKSELAAQTLSAEKHKSAGNDTQLLLDQAQDLLQVSTKEVTAAQFQLSKAVDQQRVLETQSQEQQEQTRSLQRELIKAQELLATREYELKAQASQLSTEVEKQRRDHSQLQLKLSTQEAELSECRIKLARREKELDDIQQALQSEVEEKGDLEHQVKGYLVANTRQNKAFQEIMRLIEWATTPPSSARSSAIGLDGGGATTPTHTARSDRVTPNTQSSAQKGLHFDNLPYSNAACYHTVDSPSIANTARTQQQLPHAMSSPKAGTSSPRLSRRSLLKENRSAFARQSLQFGDPTSMVPGKDCKSSPRNPKAKAPVTSHGFSVGKLELEDSVNMAIDDVNSPMALVASRDQVL